MKKYLVSTLFLFYAAVSFAQWNLVNPPPTSEDLFSVHFPSATIGYSVGSNGVIIKTVDGGENWFTLNSGTAKDLLSVFFPTVDSGYAVGNSGTILITCNGGNNWFPATSGITSDVTSVNFTTSSIGYAVGRGGEIIKTTDGGVSWELKQMSSSHLTSVHFSHQMLGYAVGGNGTILHTEDEGQTWSNNSYSVPTPISDVYFINADDGFCSIVSDGYYCLDICKIEFLKTTDGGESWNYIWDTVPSIKSINAIFFTDKNNGYAVGRDHFYGGGVIYKTSDQGLSWNELSTGDVQTLKDVFFTDTNNGCAVGYSGTILITKSGGINAVTEVSKKTKSIISPNPANKYVTISNPSLNSGTVEISIYDDAGRLVYVTTSLGQNNIPLDVSNLKPGIYIIKIKHSDESEIIKFVVQ